jgi:ribose transport system substrate-binding protein
LLISAVIAAACGGSPSSGPAATTKKLVVFMPPGTDNYLAEWERGAKQEAAQLGYEIKIVENKFDQSEEDVQVQQQLASGDKPGAYVWWPVDNAAGVASLRKLGQSGVPVIAANQLPLPGTESFWAAYSGVDDVLNGQTSGKMMIELRDKLKAKGMQFHSPGGNVMIVFFPQGYSAGTDRIKGFQAATSGSGITIIDQQPASMPRRASRSPHR